MNIQKIKDALNFILARRYREVGGDLFEDERRLLSFMPDAFGNCRRYRKEYEFLSDCFTGEILKIVIDITSQSEIEKQSTIQKIISCWTNKYNMDEQKASDLVEFFVRALHENNDNQGLKKVRKSEEQGDANGQRVCDDSYLFGCGENKDYAKAVDLYSKAAKQDNANAQFMLGQCYFFGFGVKKRDREQAVKWYSDAARQGVAVAQFMLGQCYFFGFGVKKEDRKQAVELYREAAGGDIPDTQLNYDVTTNVTTSWKWQIRKCHYRAQFMLGQCYFFGCGVKKDYSKAEDWYLKLLLFGGKDIGAQFMHDQCFYLRYGAEKDYAKAVDRYHELAEQDNADAQFMLGQHFFFGCDVEKDYAKAVDWYRKAAEQNHACALFALGDCYFYGHGITPDLTKAAELYSKAAEKGDTCAQCALGDCYFYGFGKDINWAEAAKFYSKAAEQGDAYAELMLRNFCDVNQ